MSEKMKNAETTEMVVVGGFAEISCMDVLQDAVADDCAGLEFQFNRIQMPAGGSTAFELPGEDEDDT
jgi:hypothetical protein